jgi:hypothetical protein
MKQQKHINTILKTDWCRCKSVDFNGGMATWELSKTGQYSFFDAYRMSPHRQLLQAGDDDALREFVRAWGPLRASLEGWTGSDSVDSYRRERDRLVATVRLLTAVEEREMQRPALLNLSEFSRKDTTTQLLLQGLRSHFQILGGTPPGFDVSLQSWLETATQKQTEAATTVLVSALSVFSFPRFTVEQGRRGNTLKASLGIHNLANALEWMVWQDIFQQRPFQFCGECRRLFQSHTRHEKKYCSKECAHRKTARESAQRKRKERKDNNVPKKTR